MRAGPRWLCKNATALQREIDIRAASGRVPEAQGWEEKRSPVGRGGRAQGQPLAEQAGRGEPRGDPHADRSLGPATIRGPQEV